MVKKKKKKEKWLKFRHKVVRNVVFPFLKPYVRLKYGIRIKKFREQRKHQPYLILYNHQTAFDQFFVGMSFSGPVYYLASEDLFSKGLLSSLLRWAVAPIPIRKQSTDVTAVMNCMRVAKEGGTIAIAPEGNRTYSGTTEYMNPAIATLAKRLKMPIALYRIEGGYGVHPRWSDVLRKGKMTSYVSEVIEAEEVAALSPEELLTRIKTGLYVDEGNANHRYLSSKRAEYLERAIYVCPKCGFANFESNGNQIRCTSCDLTVHYGEDTELSSTDKAFPFSFVSQWYKYQKSFVNGTDPLSHTQTPLFRDSAKLSLVHVEKHKEVLYEDAQLSLYGDRIAVNEGQADARTFSFDELSAVAVLGKNKVNLYHGKDLYQLKSHKRFNGLKYVNLYYRYKNVTGGAPYGEFLGL
ncbi:MAG: 1-acyl-sn-glycerol-3-phosphate acyltransferase [Oscillospiraceae bacterium]|nr:1-acyl-sn-glycerol-3-phosphate acyltransferase [Oscillospiraceae bacterium]